MDKSPISFRSIGLTIILSFIILFLIGFQDVFYHKTKVVFCDVGQGDAAYIRTKGKVDILVDAGPDRKVLSCLGKHMPFYDHKIELAILSHPQKDHYGGYLQILDRYQIDNFIMAPVNSNNQSFNQLKGKLLKLSTEKKTKIKSLFAGEKIILKSVSPTTIEVLWPKKELVVTNPTDLNEFSAVFIFSQEAFDVLFTGDLSLKVIDSFVNLPPTHIDILKVPHHGSKNGLTKKFLMLADPSLSVISVGKNNAYGHPAKEVLDIFKALKKKYLRTDEKGDIVVEVDEKGWRIK